MKNNEKLKCTTKISSAYNFLIIKEINLIEAIIPCVLSLK